MSLWPDILQFCTFLCVALSESRCIFAFELSLSHSSSFSMLFIHSTLLLCFLRSHILLCSFFVFFCFVIMQLFVCLRVFTLYLMVEFISLIWNVLFCLYYLILSQDLSFPSFASSFLIISLSSIVYFNCCAAFLFSTQRIPTFFLSHCIFSCCCRFLLPV